MKHLLQVINMDIKNMVQHALCQQVVHHCGVVSFFVNDISCGDHVSNTLVLQPRISIMQPNFGDIMLPEPAMKPF